MATTVAFTPSAIAPFQFQAAFDGATYNVIVTWNVYRAGWYINVYAANGTLIVIRALVGSAPAYPLSLVAGYFTSTLIFLPATQQFVISP